MSASDVSSTASGEQFARVGGLRTCYETFGSDRAPALLLVMGLASQMLLWDDRFCEELAAGDLRVIRFDNRDVGRSTILRDAHVPARWQLALRHPAGAPYALEAMADDAAGLLDHLEIDAAHVVGASMGAMIAQLIAIREPERVRSLVSIMSTTGNRRVGRPNPRVALRMLRPTARDRDAYIEDHVQTSTPIRSCKPRHHEHLPPRNRQLGDHRHRPPTTCAHAPSQRRTPLATLGNRGNFGFS